MTSIGNIETPAWQPYARVLLSMVPLAYWRLGEPKNTSGGLYAQDVMGLYHGTFSNTVSGAAGLLKSDPDQATTFSGTGTYIQVSAALILGAMVNSSVVVWLNASAQAADKILYGERNAAGNDIWEFGMQATTGRPIFTHRTDSATLDQLATTSGTYTANGTHMFAVTKAGTALLMYADGAQVFSGTLTGNDTLTQASLSQIGADSVGANFPGVLDEVALFNRTITAAEIARLYSVGTT